VQLSQAAAHQKQVPLLSVVLALGVVITTLRVVEFWTGRGGIRAGSLGFVGLDPAVAVVVYRRLIAVEFVADVRPRV
jgi:hypothetical protein